jgi:hypothetical protein
MHGEPTSAKFGAIDDVVVDERRRMDELDDGRIEDGLIPDEPAESSGQQQQRRPEPLAAAALDVTADFRNELHARLHVAHELSLDLLEVVADRLEYLREV